MHSKKIDFLKSILRKEKFALLDLAGEPSPLVLCFRHSQGQIFSLVSSDKTLKAEMSDWLQAMRHRFRGAEFKFETRFPENLKGFKDTMQAAFKKTSP